jgi:hypothetical protein
MGERAGYHLYELNFFHRVLVSNYYGKGQLKLQNCDGVCGATAGPKSANRRQSSTPLHRLQRAVRVP